MWSLIRGRALVVYPLHGEDAGEKNLPDIVHPPIMEFLTCVWFYIYGGSLADNGLLPNKYIYIWGPFCM